GLSSGGRAGSCASASIAPNGSNAAAIAGRETTEKGQTASNINDDLSKNESTTRGNHDWYRIKTKVGGRASRVGEARWRNGKRAGGGGRSVCGVRRQAKLRE